MNSFEESKRQLRIALIAIAIIFPVAILGFMIIEGMSFLDALWLTIITLGTIGYGDVIPHTTEGRIFTILLLIFGLGAFAVAAQAAIQFFISPAIRDIRQRNRAERKIRALRDHYVICGEGELVDKTINFVLKRAELRRMHEQEAVATPVDQFLSILLGRKETGRQAWLRARLRWLLVSILALFNRSETILDAVVVVTKDEQYTYDLRAQGLLVINDDPTDDRALRRAGVPQAKAAIAMLESDAETLLSVLTIRSRSASIFITATTLDNLDIKMTRVGANNVLAPYDVAGQFLNNATLRPAVNDFFNSILFDQRASDQIVQLFLSDNSELMGQTLGALELRERFNAGVIGLRLEDGIFIYAPNDDHILKENEVLLVVAPGSLIPSLEEAWYTAGNSGSQAPNWQRLPLPHVIQTSEKRYSMIEAEDAIREMSSHFVICGAGPIIRNSLDKLNPERPFVVITDEQTLASEMLKRGFRVVLGNPASEETLFRGGVDRALAIMVSIEDKANSVHTVLNCRTMSKRLLITATASTDDMIPKLRRAGADRVVSPFRIAAQFVLLATTGPVVSDFMQYVIFNYQDGIETTELYTQDDSPWIGKTIGELLLKRIFQAGVIGVRQSNGLFVYAPPDSYVIGPKEVLIVTTPMTNSDELRHIAHGGEDKRPQTLRTSDGTRTISGIGRRFSN